MDKEGLQQPMIEVMQASLYVKYKESEDCEVERLAQGHITRVQSSESQPSASSLLTDILFSPAYFSKTSQHSYEVGRVGNISTL